MKYHVEIIGWLKGKQEPYINRHVFVADSTLELLRLMRDHYDATPQLVKWVLLRYYVDKSVA